MATTQFDTPVRSEVTELKNNLGSPSSASAVTGADAFSKINTLNSNLGSPSSASSVTGADAFSKIDSLNSNKSNLLMRTSKSATTAASSPYGWSATLTNAGYIPLLCTETHGYSGQSILAIESISYGDGTCTVSGYANAGGRSVTVEVLWVKNT